MRSAPIYVSAVFGLLFLVAPAFGRKLENWPYERLFKEADLVVIATADGTADTKDRFMADGWNVQFIGQETTATVVASLKGNAKGEKKIKLLHYRLPEGVLINDGPLLVTFRKESMPLKGTINGTAFKAALGKPDYMLFLRARPDGRFEPVSGQIDPVLSVREVHRPERFLSELGRK